MEDDNTSREQRSDAEKSKASQSLRYRQACKAIWRNLDTRGGTSMAFDLSMPILVVDDYNSMTRILRNLLKQLGMENVDEATDGSAALIKMRGKTYGLVISDWNMAPMTGYDLLMKIRDDPKLADTPFIIITTESSSENVLLAKKAGADNYIVKPFNAATLKTKIDAVFLDRASE